MDRDLLAQQVSLQQLNTICGVSLRQTEYQACVSRAQIIEPDIGKLWTEREIATGLYIILSGKVRLLNTDDEPIASVETGQSFGEYTSG